MKLNWGTGLMLAMACFIVFILFLVITMTTNKELDHDLVTEEYYQQEIDFQNQLEKQINTRELSTPVSVHRTTEGFLIYFPDEFRDQKIDGKVSLYRPSNKNMDFEIPFSSSSQPLLIPQDRLVTGRWNMIIDWTNGHQDFMFKKQLKY